MLKTKINQKGRFGNKFIRNMIIYIISNKINLKSMYESDIENNVDSFHKLGLNFVNDKKLELPNIKIKSNEIINILENKHFQCQNYIYILDGFYQNPEIIKHIYNYFKNINNSLSQSIIFNNPYKKRYNNNNDVFIHLRSGDIFVKNTINPNLNYYIELLDKFKNNKIYLASDNFNSNICKTLLSNYKVIKYNSDKIDTLQFGSTCKYVILSSGSYSLTLSLISFYSNIYYSSEMGKLQENKEWHPDFFKLVH